ncbi:MAG: exonuclease SbcCD subunit D C-terminal domain-containing protein [Psychrobium sp.]|nr:exonuclease SbcCD subunit D C-terminal domain-containing protein [Psychrobium sp.]
MRIFHTSDWHLGHQLLGISREFEQQAFLNWLFEQLKEQQADALIVAGDIFDSANPPAWSWRLLYQFLAKVKQSLPSLDLLLMAGNHDSPSKLDAPDHLLRAFDIHLIGALPRHDDNSLDLDKLIIELKDKTGEVAVRVAAVPFLRAGDLDLSTLDKDVNDKLVAGVERVYQQIGDEIARRNNDDQASVAMAHAYLVSSQISEMSERRILGGNQHALPIDIFATRFDYTALGHLHKPQQLGGQNVYYSGSVIPMSLAEKDYKHQVKVVDFSEGKLSSVNSLHIPRTVQLMKIPSIAQPLDEVLALLANIDLPWLDPHLQPLLEVVVLLDKPQAMLREKINQALQDKPVRLVKITSQYHEKDAKTPAFDGEILEQLQPEHVFSLKYFQQYNKQPEAKYLSAFSQLLSDCQQDNSEP